MQTSTSHDLEIQDFVNDCRTLCKKSLSTVKMLIYLKMSDSFMPEVFFRMMLEIQNATNLYQVAVQMKMEIHPHILFHYFCSTQSYLYEIWMRRVLFQLEALLVCLKRIAHKLLEFYTTDSLVTALRLIYFYNILISSLNSLNADIPQNSNVLILDRKIKRKFTVFRILKVIARKRSKECAYTLIQYLMNKYNETYELNYFRSSFDFTDDAENDPSCGNEDDDVQHDSDDTSILVYKTLAQYASPPRSASRTCLFLKNSGIQAHKIVLATVVTSERRRLGLLLSIVNTNPLELFSERDLVISKKSGCLKICSKMKRKLMNVYEQILWQNVGIIGEHMLLWWTNFALGRRNQIISQKFRTWLKQSFTTEVIHSVVEPTIHSLIDCLCCFTTITSWDELFSKALISADNQHSRHAVQNIGLGTKTGHLFSDVLYDVVFLTNSCEGSNWTRQDLENLPLVEQIPLLHRLDHTIHTARIWAIGRAKYLTNCWQIEQFFKVTHVDINASLYALSQLKLTQNINSIENQNSHFTVCSKMRSKLASEVYITLGKLEQIPNQSLKILASVCKITSLALLKIHFPSEIYWQQRYEHQPQIASEYVEKYLDEILKPVLLASQNLPLPVQKSVSKLILEILCEAWLDHIYDFRIKFSIWGAAQLLRDFSAIQVWIQEKMNITDDVRQFLTSDEILRRCEGVGRLLLRHPGESIIMSGEKKSTLIPISELEDYETTPETAMPPEMYVPNQEKWLKLRLTQQESSVVVCCQYN